MAELEKGNSSTGKDKGKMSHLDEDISDDFLTSWKSASMTGGDDMDFNFEPVTKGNKKAFDFGKLDMDFSLDGEFGKLSSFKLDMPDLDFSNSPKKSTKSKEKSENDSVKENLSARKNDFTFSFDFKGLDDFSFEAPSTRGNNPSKEKSSEHVGSMDKTGSDDLHRQALKDNGAPEDTIKRPNSVPEDALHSKSENLVNAEGNLDTSSRSHPDSEVVVDLAQPKETQISSHKILSDEAQVMTRESLPGKTSNKSNDQGTVHNYDFAPHSISTSKPIPVKSANSHVASEAKLRTDSQGSEKEIKATEKISKPSYADLKAKDQPAKPFLTKTLSQANSTEPIDICSANGTLNNSSSEACTDTIKPPPFVTSASDIDKVELQKLSENKLTDKSSKESQGKNELRTVGASSSAAFALDIADPSRPRVRDTLSSDAKYHTDAPRSTSKFFSASYRSGSTTAKPTEEYKVPVGSNSKLSRLEEKNDGATTRVSTLGNNREDTAKLDGKERKEENEKKLDDNSSSSTITLVYQDSVSGKIAKNAHADNVFSREIDENVNVKIRDEVGVNEVSQDGQALKNEFMLQSEKKINDSKLSSFQVPHLVSTEQKTKLSNQEPGYLKDKIQSKMSLPKSNFFEPNRLSSLRFGKKLQGLRSLNLQGNVGTTKHSVSPVMLENAKSGRNLEKTVSSLAVTNIIPSIGAEKQRPLTPSLKRKQSEVADVGSIKLPPSKRLSPNSNRVAQEVSTKEFEDEAHRQGTVLEAGRKNLAASPKFDFCQEVKMEELGLLVESDENIEKAESCAKELDDICSMLRKKHEEAKELLVRALVNNNHLLMLNHPIYEEKIRAVQKFATKVMSKKLEAGI